MSGSPNDVSWEIFDVSRVKIGESMFHVSCSDDDMDGVEDCGKNQGDGKGNDPGLVNDWLLEGMSGGVLTPPETLDCSAVATDVEVDIMPGSEPNAINPLAQGLIPVAILGSDSFDVLDVDPGTLAFGPNAAFFAHTRNGPHFADVDDDGFEDLLAHFRTQETGIEWVHTEACLTWENMEGTPSEGCDDIKIVPACGIGFELALLLPPLMWLRRRRRH
jgi:hypothetical protein